MPQGTNPAASASGRRVEEAQNQAWELCIHPVPTVRVKRSPLRVNLYPVSQERSCCMPHP
jgi:hypothetical protein